MKVTALENEVKSSRNQRHFSSIILLLMFLMSILNFSLVNSALPSLNSIGPQGTVGVDGKPGLQGPVGLQGTQGLPGMPGVRGEPGPTGAVGSQGPIGEQGAPGEQGTSGETGQNGRDLEQRCREVDGQTRIEQRYSGNLSWQVAYYLPPGSTCG